MYRHGMEYGDGVAGSEDGEGFRYYVLGGRIPPAVMQFKASPIVVAITVSTLQRRVIADESMTNCQATGTGTWDLGNRNREYPQSQEMTVKSHRPPTTHPTTFNHEGAL